MSNIYKGTLGLVGNTPLVEVTNIEKDLGLEASEVEALCRRCGVTENIFAVASFGICAGLYAGMNEALFTTIYNGRDSLRTARTIAMLVKTLPVYSKFEKDQTIRDYLSSAKEQMLGCMNNDIYSAVDFLIIIFFKIIDLK